MFRQRRRFRSSKAADEGKAVPKAIPVLFLSPFSLSAYSNFLDIPSSTTMMSNELHLISSTVFKGADLVSIGVITL